MATKKLDTLLGVCLVRSAAGIAEAEGIDLTARKGQKLKAIRLAMSSTPKASRVAGFVVEWALALDELKADDLTLTEWRNWSLQSQRTAWRHLAEFRELFPEYETPTPLARQVLRNMRSGKLNAAAAINLPVTV